MKQYRTGEVQYIPTIAQSLTDKIPVAAMPNPEAYLQLPRSNQQSRRAQLVRQNHGGVPATLLHL
jgi:hypothetical protein